MVELVNTNNLGLFDREIVQVQVLFPLVDLFYINPASFIPLNSRFIPSRPQYASLHARAPFRVGVREGVPGGSSRGLLLWTKGHNFWF